MKRLFAFVLALVATATIAFAHGNNDHVRGTVTEISATSMTVQVSPQVVKTLALNDKTTFDMGGKTAHLADLKIGDRVVVDVPKGKNEALSVRFGAPAKK
jgi:hypothetical protein